MTHRTPRFFTASAALAALVALSGCEYTEAPAIGDNDNSTVGEFDSSRHLADDGQMTLHDVPTQTLEGALPYPTIDSFKVSPAHLPLGGGEVIFEWKARDAATCALVDADRQIVAIGSAQDRAEIDVDEAGDFELICSDEDNEDSSAAMVEVQVETAPDVSLDTLGAKLAYVNNDKQDITDSFGAAYAHQWVLNIFETSQVLIDIAPDTDNRDMVNVWLVADDDDDAAIHWTEVVDYARSNHGESISATLDAGRYHVIVEAVNAADDYRMDYMVTPTAADGSF
jgi:hypothetical protein